jgi:hypothetical protein
MPPSTNMSTAYFLVRCILILIVTMDITFLEWEVPAIIRILPVHSAITPASHETD